MVVNMYNSSRFYGETDDRDRRTPVSFQASWSGVLGVTNKRERLLQTWLKLKANITLTQQNSHA